MSPKPVSTQIVLPFMVKTITVEIEPYIPVSAEFKLVGQETVTHRNWATFTLEENSILKIIVDPHRITPWQIGCKIKVGGHELWNKTAKLGPRQKFSKEFEIILNTGK